MEERLRDLEQEQKARDKTIAGLAALVAPAQEIPCVQVHPQPAAA